MEIRPIRVGGLLLPSNVLMAPLAGYSCYPFRVLCQEMGAGVCYTEMVSANALKYQDRATGRLLFTTEEERIKAVQLLGGEPHVMQEMACSERLKEFAILDINMGCPVPNVFKSGEGSALLGDLRRAEAVIRGCKRSGKVVTVKGRVGIHKDRLMAAEFARMCEAAGADMVTIHGRTRDMMYTGTPFYEQLEQAKAAVSIPVIGNGGIFSVADADTMMERTGVDGVMIARYALENPFIFCELTGRACDKSQKQMLLEQLALVSVCYEETDALAYMKKLMAYGMKKKKGTKKHKMALYQSGNLEELREMIGVIFGEEGKLYDGEWV